MVSPLRYMLWNEDEAQPRTWARPALWPAAAVYRGVLAVRQRWGSVSRGGRRLSVPVLSVGNLVMGGTGKTPVAIWMAEALLDRGRRPVLLSRGYGGRAGRGPLVVSDGKQIYCGPDEAGDETVMVARRLAQVPVVAGSDRYSSGTYAVEHFGVDCAILDDGFQHVSLHRDLNVLLLDSSRPFGNGKLFPLGPLREPPSAMSRAGLVVFTRWDERGDARSEIETVVEEIGEHRIAKTSHCIGRLYSLTENRTIDGQNLLGKGTLLVTGIANPRSFENTVRRLGAVVRKHIRYPDHHRFTDAELRDAEVKARARRAEYILTTGKDAVRLPPGVENLDIPVIQVEMSIHVEEGLGVIDHMLEDLFVNKMGKDG